VHGSFPVALVEAEADILRELVVRCRLLGFDVDLDVVSTSRGGDFVAPDRASEGVFVLGSPVTVEGVSIVEGEEGA
jgi:hypothetical protein